MRALKAQWSDWQRPAGAGRRCSRRCAPARSSPTRRSSSKGEPPAHPRAPAAVELKATYYWPIHTHGSIGPSCAIADVQGRRRDDLDRLAGHARQPRLVRTLPRPAAGQGAADLPRRRRLLRHERPRGLPPPTPRSCRAPSAGRCACNGCARTSTAGTPRARRNCSTSSASIDAEGRIVHWRTEMWLPQATARPAVRPAARPGRGRPRPADGLQHRPDRRRTATRPTPPGSINVVGALAEGHAAAAGADPLAGQARQLLRGRELLRRAGGRGQARPGRDAAQARLSDPRGLEVLQRIGAMMKWESRPSPGPDRVGRGRARPRHRLHPLQAQRDLRRDGHGGRGRARHRPHPCRAGRAARTTAGRSSTPTACAPRSRATSSRR